MAYPTNYEWLGRIGLLPLMVTEALKEYGTVETPGRANNAKIMAWAKELGLSDIYSADAVPWCGLFIDLVAKRAKKARVKNPLWALNHKNFGTDPGQPGLGDVLVYLRDGGGHVGLYIAEDNECYHTLGGNQGDCVSITRIYKKRLVAARRSKVLIRHPASVKPYIVKPTGAIASKLV